MQITKEAIEQRIEQLQRQAEQHRADLVAIDGAIQDCKFWLEQVQQPEQLPQG